MICLLNYQSLFNGLKLLGTLSFNLQNKDLGFYFLADLQFQFNFIY